MMTRLTVGNRNFHQLAVSAYQAAVHTLGIHADAGNLILIFENGLADFLQYHVKLPARTLVLILSLLLYTQHFLSNEAAVFELA